MTMLSRLALAATLAGGTMLAVAPPVLAKDKPAAQAPGMKLTPAFVKVAKPAQDAVNGADPAAAEPLVAQSEAAATNDDEKFVAGQMRLVLEQKKINAARAANPNAPIDQSGLIKPLDAMIANPSTPQADRARYYFYRGGMAYDGKQFPVAVDYFTKARDLGYTSPDLGLLLVKARIESGDVAGGTAELDKAIADKTAHGEKAPDEWYKYAITQSNRRHLTPQTVDWLNKYAVAYPSQKTWYEVLATYGIQQDPVAKLDNQQKIDLFRLMRAAGALPDQYFYIEYAQKTAIAGLPNEAQAVLKEGMANGKIPPANSEAKAMLTETANGIRNEGSLPALEAKAKAAATGATASQTADVYLGTGNYAKAIELYRLALTKGGVDADTVNTRMGIALARSGDKAGAQAAFAAVKGAPRADLARFWMTWLNQAPAA